MTLKQLFSIRRIRNAVIMLHKEPDKSKSVFSDSDFRKKSYQKARKTLERYLFDTNESKQREIDEVLNKLNLGDREYDKVKILYWLLRYSHLFLIDDGFDSGLDPSMERLLFLRFLSILLEEIGSEHVGILSSFIKISRILLKKIRFPLLEGEISTSVPNNDTKSSSQTFVFSKNKVIDFIGLFIPSKENDSGIGGCDLSYSYNELEALEHKLTPDLLNSNNENEFENNPLNKAQNEAKVQTTLERTLDTIQVLAPRSTNITYSTQVHKDIIIKRNKYTIIPDASLTIKKDGKVREIPIECKKDRIIPHIKNFNIVEPLSPKSYPYCHLFSQLVRESVASSSSTAIAYAPDSIFYFEFQEVMSDEHIRGKEIVTAIKCFIHSIHTGAQLLACLLKDFEVSSGERFSNNVMTKCYVAEGVQSRIIPIYKEKLQEMYEVISNEIITEDISMIHGSEVASDKIWRDELLEGYEEIGLKEHQLLMVSKLSLVYGDKFKIEPIETYLKGFLIEEIIQGEIWKYNSIVLKLREINTNKTCILKIIDPLFSRASSPVRYDLKKSFTKAFEAYMKDIYCLHILKQYSFVAEVYATGILTNQIFDYQNQIEPTTPITVSGFFIAMEFLEGNPLGTLRPGERRKYAGPLVVCLKSMHKLCVYHNDITSGNVIICNGQVKLIDYGQSVLNRKRLKTALRLEEEFTNLDRADRDIAMALHITGASLETIVEVDGNLDDSADADNLIEMANVASYSLESFVSEQEDDSTDDNALSQTAMQVDKVVLDNSDSNQKLNSTETNRGSNSSQTAHGSNQRKKRKLSMTD